LTLALHLQPFDRAAWLLLLKPGLVNAPKLKAAVPPAANYFVAQNARYRGGGVNRFQLNVLLRWADLRVSPEVRPQLAVSQQPVVEANEAAFELESSEEPLRPAVLWK
jgi:hypothetical protein